MHNYHYFVSDGELTYLEPALSQTETRVEAGCILTEILNMPDDASYGMNLLPDSAVNRGPVWQAACARLGNPICCGADDPALYILRNTFLQCMAITHIRTIQPSSMIVAGQQLRGRADAEHWRRGRSGSNVLPAQCHPRRSVSCVNVRLPTGLPNLPLARAPAAHSRRAAGDLRCAITICFSSLNPPIARGMAAALCRALLAEVAEQGKAMADRRLPGPARGERCAERLGNRRAARLADREGLWCALPAANQWPGLVFEWQPARPLRRWVVSDAVAPALEVVFTALWRDLRDEGDTIVPTRNRRPPSAQLAQPPAHRLPVRDLPRKRYFSLSGERDQGRASNGRRTPSPAIDGGSSRATWASAAEYAFLVPQGYTFVRPHVAGLQGQEPTETELESAFVRGWAGDRRRLAARLSCGTARR